jgi:hypothetical protein
MLLDTVTRDNSNRGDSSRLFIRTFATDALRCECFDGCSRRCWSSLSLASISGYRAIVQVYGVDLEVPRAAEQRIGRVVARREFGARSCDAVPRSCRSSSRDLGRGRAEQPDGVARSRTRRGASPWPSRSRPVRAAGRPGDRSRDSLARCSGRLPVVREKPGCRRGAMMGRQARASRRESPLRMAPSCSRGDELPRFLGLPMPCYEGHPGKQRLRKP